LALTVLAVTAGFLGVSGTAAQAHDHSGPSPTTNPLTAPNPSGAAVFLAAELSGRNEVPVAGGPAVGDPDGHAVEVLRIQGNQVSFGVAWRNLGALTASHIHEGVAGVNGAVKVPFFGTALPANLNGATGKVTVADPALLDALRTNPEKFYANLHTAQFPGGAVRGQLRKLHGGVDLVRFLRFGSLVSLLDGDQEVPVAGGPAVGDPDGHATGFISAYGRQVDFTFSFFGIAPPTLVSLGVVVGGVGARPRAVDGRVEIRDVVDLTVTIDHNVVDGAPATRFGADLRRLVESAAILRA